MLLVVHHIHYSVVDCGILSWMVRSSKVFKIWMLYSTLFNALDLDVLTKAFPVKIYTSLVSSLH